MKKREEPLHGEAALEFWLFLFSQRDLRTFLYLRCTELFCSLFRSEVLFRKKRPYERVLFRSGFLSTCALFPVTGFARPFFIVDCLRRVSNRPGFQSCLAAGRFFDIRLFFMLRRYFFVEALWQNASVSSFSSADHLLLIRFSFAFKEAFLKQPYERRSVYLKGCSHFVASLYLIKYMLSTVLL